MASLSADVIKSRLTDRFHEVTLALLGPPNQPLSTDTELRYGNHGSLSVQLSGPKGGSWFDHEGQVGGDVLELIRYREACSFPQAIEWGARWLGIECDTPTSAARPTAKKTTADHARQYAKEMTSPAGTVAADYVCDTRGISITDFPPDIGFHANFYHPHEKRPFHALLLIGRDGDDKVQFVHGVCLEGAKKAPIEQPKITYGAITGAKVRLPGTALAGAVTLAEGPEDGLTVWAATGREVWICCGVANFAHVALPEGTPVTIATQNDAAGSKAANTLRKAVRELKARGFAVAVVRPPAGVKDWNDLLRQGGAEAVRAAFDAQDQPAPAEDQGEDRVAIEAELERIETAAERLAALPPAVRDLRLKDEAKALGIGVRTLVREIKTVLARERQAQAEAAAEAPDADDRIELEVKAADLPATARQVAKLLAKEPMLFDRGGPARLAYDQSRRGLVCEPLTTEGVVNAVHDVARPFEWAASPDGIPYKDYVTLPDRVAKLYRDLKGRWGLRPLDGIASAPLLAEDGTIRIADGYDAGTRMWCERMPSIAVAERPTRGEAERALALLRYQFRTFAFADSPRIWDDKLGVDVVDTTKPAGMDESAALVALMTAVARPSLPLAPGVAVKAPSMSGAGTGKGLLVRAICAVANGTKPRAMTAGSDPQEFDKRITASLIGAEPVLFLDNLNGQTLRSDLMASAITENPAVVRTLGKSDQVLLNPVAFIAITGNGLALSEDLTRRFMIVELDAGLEDPESRPFKGDLVADVLERRGELLRAVLTLWRWGRQNQLPAGQTMGSFDAWGRWCRDPLVALGCADPAKRAAAAKADDPRRLAIAELFNAWWAAHNNDPVKLADLAESVRDVADPNKRGRQYLTAYIRKLERTRLGGFILTRHSPDGKWSADHYRLLQLKPDSPEDRMGRRPAPESPMPPKEHRGSDLSIGGVIGGTNSLKYNEHSPKTPMPPYDFPGAATSETENISRRAAGGWRGSI